MSKTIAQGKEQSAALCQYFATNRQAFLACRRGTGTFSLYEFPLLIARGTLAECRVTI